MTGYTIVEKISEVSLPTAHHDQPHQKLQSVYSRNIWRAYVIAKISPQPRVDGPGFVHTERIAKPDP